MNINDTLFEFHESIEIDLKDILKIYNDKDLKIYTNYKIKYIKAFSSIKDQCKFIEEFSNLLN